MIYVDKTIVETPEDLLNESHTQENCELFDNNPAAYNAGAKFSSHNTYKTDQVKNALRTTQGGDENGNGGKCAYCEKYLREEAAHVDHFRPKGAVMEEDGVRIYPGYYWLAYSWENLFITCLACNCSFKKDFFPLSDTSKRIRSHHDRDKIDMEAPLLINPSVDDPRDHIRFKLDVPIPFENSEKGEKTIDILKLYSLEKRPNLIKERLRVLNILRMFREIIENSFVAPEHLEDYKNFLVDSTKLSNEFSSMARDYLDDFIKTI